MASSTLDMLTFLREQQQEFLRVKEQEKQTSRSLSAWRRGMLADRPGYAGVVNVGAAANPLTDARLAQRMAGLAEDDPQRVAYEQAQATEGGERFRHRMRITGEEYDVGNRIGDIERAVAQTPGSFHYNYDEVSALQKQIAELEKIGGERAGRYADREDLAAALEQVRRRLQTALSRSKRWGQPEQENPGP